MALNFELSEEQQMIQNSARDLMKKFEPRREELIRMIMKEKKFPEEMWQAISEAGFLGSLIPEEYGGSNLGLLALAFAVEQMGIHGYGNVILILTAMDSLAILRNGSEELKRRFLPKIAQGKVKLCFAVTEPNAGSNTFRITTMAKKNGSGYAITGQKTFITGADVADYCLLVTRTMSIEEAQAQGFPKAYGLSVFLVDTKARGFGMKPIPTRGIEGMTQFTLYLDGVHVPSENIVGEEHLGSYALFNTLNPERILAAAQAVGIVNYLLRKAVEYAHERKVFKDRPIGSYQAIQHPLAEIKIEEEAARLLTYRAAWAFDQQKDPGQIGTMANMAKFLAAETAIKAADRAIETLGGYGFSEEYGVIHYWEAMRLLRTAPISREMILNYVSEHVLGLPRSY